MQCKEWNSELFVNLIDKQQKRICFFMTENLSGKYAHTMESAYQKRLSILLSLSFLKEGEDKMILPINP